MSFAVAPSLTIPLKKDASGVIRVGGTRVSLDTIIFAYNEGSDAEDIVDQFDSLKLADVHAVISYYLQNRDEIEFYLEERKKFREQVRQVIEAHSDQTGIRERLLAREFAKTEAYA